MHRSAEPGAAGRRSDLSYELWLERNAYTTALLYSAIIGILLPAFHYVLSALPGVQSDSLPLRLICTVCSFVVACILLLIPRARRFAALLQGIQVVVALIVISALIVNSGDHDFYIASGLLVIIGAQNAFYNAKTLAYALGSGFAFMVVYSALRGMLFAEYNLTTLAIFATGYTLAFIPAWLHIRSQETAIRSRLEAQQATSDLEEAHAISHLGKWSQDLDTGHAEWSAEIFRIFDFPEDSTNAALPDFYERAMHPDDRAHVGVELERSQRTGEEFTVDHRIVLASGKIRWVQLRGKHELDETGKAVRRLGTVMDITARKEAEISLERLARYDQLTSLPNRTTLSHALSESLHQAKTTLETGAVLFLDLDRFKDINDTLGHSVGDMLLKAVAMRLQSLLPQNALVARWGGDEFVAVLPAVAGEAAVERICERLVHGLAEPFVVNAYEFAVAASIGVAMYPKDGTDPELLIRNADTAMYTAKEDTVRSFAFFAPQMHTLASARHYVQTQLQTALTTKSLALYYQPIIDASNNRIVAAEALLRWIDADGRIRLPADFISIAEDTGSIVAIGMWVVDQAVRQAMQWRIAGMPLSVSVNISPRQLSQPDFAETLESVLRENSLDPSILEIEITESVLVPNASSVMTVLEQVKRMGVRIAVDDFGTGYSAFSYLKRLPLNTLKLDRTFVDGIERDVDRSIAESIISIAHKLQLSVTAEGVETQHQHDILTELGCNRLQGFHICKPLPVADFETFARTNDRHGASRLSP